MNVQPKIEVYYPESDGKPMGETDLHRDWMARIIELLRYRYRGQRVYVSGDLLLYFEEGEPNRCVVPDAFIVLDSDPGRRRVYKIWEEGKPPNVVFEITSRWTQREDTAFKPPKYEYIGVGEFFLYDPTSDYLKPTPLQGWRFGGDDHGRIEPDDTGALECKELGLLLRLEGNDLVMYDAATGERQLTSGEAEQAKREEEQLKRHAAESRADALEAELKKLREEINRRDT